MTDTTLVRLIVAACNFYISLTNLELWLNKIRFGADGGLINEVAMILPAKSSDFSDVAKILCDKV